MPKTEFEITAKGETIAKTTVVSKVVKCDFCSRPAGETCFIARDARMTVEPEPGDFNPFKLKHIELNSDAHWAACDPCAALVRSNDRHGLHARSAYFAPEDMDRHILAAIQAMLFWACFSGLSHPGADHPEHPMHGR